MHTERFDFDTKPDRNDIGCAKWNRRTDEEKAIGVVPMSIADMEFRCPACIIEAMHRVAEIGYYGYTDADAPYFDAVRGWMQRRHGFDIQTDWIVPHGGVVPAMSIVVRMFTEPGGKVLVQSPGYTPFRAAAEMNGRVPVFNPLIRGEDGYYRMDYDDLAAKARDPRVKLMMLCSPHNPVGRVWTAEELRRVADICRDNDVILLSDEIHSDMVSNGKHTVFLKAAPYMQDRCLILTAPSKTFNIAGLQVANTIIPNPDLRKRFRERLNADGYSNNAYFGYHAMIAAYTHGEPWLDALLAYVRENYAFFAKWLEENLPLVRLLPVEGTYLGWTDWRALGMDDVELERFVRGEAKLVLDEGTMFGSGGEGHMRFNLAIPRASLKEALDRLLIAAKRRGFVLTK